MRELIRMSNICAGESVVGQLTDFNMSIFTGEIVFLFGIHGSGKETVKAVLEGTVPISEGSLFISEERVKVFNDNISYRKGIVCIDSRQRLVDTLTINENIFAIRRKSIFPFIYQEHIANPQSRQLLDMVGLDCLPSAKVYELSDIEQQLVCFAKAVSLGAKLIIIDCINHSYSFTDIVRLQKVMKLFSEKGISFLVLDEKPNELLTFADKVVFIQNGRDTKQMFSDEMDSNHMIDYLVGNKRTHVADDQESLVDKEAPLTIQGASGNVAQVFKGQILGFYDIMWDSKRNFLEYLNCFIFKNSFSLDLWGSPLSFESIETAFKKGIVFIPEDSSECVLHNLSLEENLALPVIKKTANVFGVVNSEVVSFLKMEFLKTFNLNKEIIYMDQLSRTYCKLFFIYRWVLLKPKVMILENPMLSTDVIEFPILKQYISDLAKKGIVVIINSNNYHELSEVSDLMICSENVCFKRIYKKMDFKDIDLNEIMSKNA